MIAVNTFPTSFHGAALRQKGEERFVTREPGNPETASGPWAEELVTGVLVFQRTEKTFVDVR